MLCLLILSFFLIALTIFVTTGNQIIDSKRFNRENENELIRNLGVAVFHLFAGSFWFFLLFVILSFPPISYSLSNSSLSRGGMLIIVFLLLFLISTCLGIRNLYKFHYKYLSQLKSNSDNQNPEHSDLIETDGWDENSDDNPRVSAIRKTITLAAVIVSIYIMLLFTVFYYHFVH